MIHYDLTKSQQLIWTGQQLNPKSPQYNMAFTFEFKCKIDPEKFKKSFDILVDSMDAMRSVFMEINGVPKMLVKDAINFDFNIRHLDEADTKNEIQGLVQKSFNLNECLFDSSLFIHGDDHYTWFINQHHLITDGWSYTIQYRQLMNIYQGLEATIFQFQDYITKLPTPNEKALEFWKDEFSDLDAKPAFNQKKNERFQAGSKRIEHTLSKEKTDFIKALVLEKGLRTWSVDLGVFNLLLTVLSSTVAKLTTHKDLVIGSPALNRSNQGLKKTAGLFIEMFPIHTPIKTGETYEGLYQSILIGTNNFLRYALPETSSAALNRSFNVALNYINASFQQFADFEMEATWIHAGANDPGHHVQLQVVDFNNTGQITLAFDLNNEVFNPDEKNVIIATFLAELDSFLKDRENLIFPKEANELDFIDSINETAYTYPEKSLLDYFNENVKANPDGIALVFEGKTMSFGELNIRSTELAYYMRSIGVESQSNIGLFLPRSFELIISILAILKTQCVYIPIDINYPNRRIQFIIEDASIGVMLCMNKEKRLLDFDQVETISLDSDQENIIKASRSNIDLNYYPDHLMYIIYTSGSTGTPKGVMNKHEGVMNRLNWARKEKHLTPADIILLKTTYTFDVSGIELLLPLIVGSKMVIASPEGHKDPSYLRSIIKDEKITYIHFVPSMLAVFLLGMGDQKLPSLKRVICSGEALQVDHVKEFRRIFPHVILQNLYGPTEAAIEVASWIAPETAENLVTVPIGKPIDNVRLKILDKKGNDCGILAAGELLIGGIQVAAGYINRPELTKERFIDDNLGVRWYKTGDLCQWLKDGNIEYLGRIDDQVKVRGFRIELGEIEQVAKELDEVKSCVALVKNDQIILYSVQSQSLDLKKHLEINLPDYMVPAHFMILESIPTLDNGKIDRAKLFALPVESNIAVEAMNEFEEFVHGIWVKVLQQNNIGIKDDFFDIGGDSLSGIRVITSINAELELELPIVTIFQKTSVKALAVYIEAEIDRRMAEG